MQQQISFPESEADKIWEMFLKEKNTKLKMQIWVQVDEKGALGCERPWSGGFIVLL